MKLKKFVIIAQRDVQSLEDTNQSILLNTDHIVSVKPIKIVIDSEPVEGHWVRMSNGKKYRAIKIPAELNDLF